jgi:pimeloyl-ACP methyl ester carboxylesterase
VRPLPPRAPYLAASIARNLAEDAVVCSAFPRATQPPWTRARVRSSVPVLLVVGGTDPQDPPANVAGAARELPNSRTVIVPAGGHGSAQLGCVPRIALQFVRQGSAVGLDTRCVADYDPPRFAVAG